MLVAPTVACRCLLSVCVTPTEHKSRIVQRYPKCVTQPFA